MEYSVDVLEAVGVCGLDCRKCLAREGGDIARLSRELGERLGNFGRLAKRFAGYQPVFGKYPEFKAVLDHLAGGACLGCRSGTCIHPGCVIQPCARDKGVDFCFQCAEFPCDKPSAMPELRERWEANNRRMAEIGPTEFRRELKGLSRY